MPKGIGNIARHLPDILEDAGNGLPGVFRELLRRLGDHLKELDRQAHELDAQIQRRHRENAASRKLAAIPGIGPITASALAASVGDAKDFKDGRQFAAWPGLAPRRHSTGGRQALPGISKRGGGYLGKLPVHGARAVVRVAGGKADAGESWIQRLVGRRNKNIAAVALANENARIAWALLAHGRAYETGHVRAAAGA